ncbi:MAG: TolC family protein [Thermoanaerobaculia bacterium]
MTRDRSPNPGRPRRKSIRVAAALALILSAGPTIADDTVSVPVASRARKAVPLPAGEKIELTLQQAIQLTLENVLDLDVAAYNLEESQFGIFAARGAFDPGLEVDLGVTDKNTPASSRVQAPETKTAYGNGFLTGLLPYGTTYSLGWQNTRNDSVIPGYTLINPTLSSNLALGVTQPLLRNFGRAVNERLVVQARLGRDTNAYAFVVAVQTAIQTADSAYWDLVYAIENLKAKQEALTIAKDLNRITGIKIDVGALAPIDIVQTEVTIAQREQDIITAEGLIGDAQDRLRRLLNVQSIPDWNRPIVPTDRPSRESLQQVFSPDVNQGYETALKTRPEVKQALLTIENKKITYVYLKNQIRPRLDLSAGYGLAGLGAQTLLTNPDGTQSQLNYSDALTQIGKRDYPAWNVGLVFAVPIGNRVAKGNYAIANADLELARTNFAITKANLQLEVRAAARAVDIGYRSVAAATKARELGERNLDAEKKKFENGMSTTFQVASVANDLTTAVTAQLQAIATYLKNITAWHKAIGDLLPQRSVELSGLPISLDATPAEEGAVK